MQFDYLILKSNCIILRPTYLSKEFISKKFL